jgi:outer membrane protein assembly factor BamB
VPAERLSMPDVQQIYQSLRPFGGVAWFNIPAGSEDFVKCVADLNLPQAKIERVNNVVRMVREGPLPGSANWTHEHADAANTRVSQDKLVKAPLGLLWFGGPSHDAILPRHGHGPQPQVIDGRLLIEGMDVLRAMDIYTGRLLWEVRLPGLGRFYNNLAHQPGANATGTNFISTSDGIYVVHATRCLKLDPETGKQLAEFTLPPLPGKKEAPMWGYLNVVGDLLIGGSDPLLDPALVNALLARSDGAPQDKGDSIFSKLSIPRMDNDNLSSSKHLVVMDRQTGAVRWSASSRLGFRHNAICVGGGRLYAIDRLSGPELARMKRRGQEPKDKPRLVVFDLDTGHELWQTEADVFGTWLSYSAKHDVLVEAGRVARDTLVDEAKGMRAYRANTGAVLWHQPGYVGPAMIHGDLVLKDRSACDLLTGAPTQRRDPLTGKSLEWTWMRNYGCNTPMASEHLLTFRSGAAGYFDLSTDGGTGNFGGFRSGCTNNLIVAGGLLVAPDYTRTCTCNYQNQTSLALVHMPDAEIWTFFGSREVDGPLVRLGINFGAPGNRKADDGTLWLEYPRVGGPSPMVPVKVTPDEPVWFRRHASQVSGNGWPWVTASGGKGIEKVSVTLDDKAKETRTYTVRLYFAEPELLKPGERVFGVAVQGRQVLKDFDIVKEAGGPNRGVVKEFCDIEVTGDLTVEFAGLPSARERSAVICGIEVLAQKHAP